MKVYILFYNLWSWTISAVGRHEITILLKKMCGSTRWYFWFSSFETFWQLWCDQDKGRGDQPIFIWHGMWLPFKCNIYVTRQGFNRWKSGWRWEIKNYYFATTAVQHYKCWADGQQNYIACSNASRVEWIYIYLYCLVRFENESQFSHILSNSAWSYQRLHDFLMSESSDVQNPSAVARRRYQWPVRWLPFLEPARNETWPGPPNSLVPSSTWKCLSPSPPSSSP